MTGQRLTGRGSLTERIEQAIARGLTVARICDTLGATAEQVHKAWDHLDEITDEDADVDHELVDQSATIATLPSYWDGRPIASYFGPAAPEVIERLVDAVCPPRSARRLRKGWAAA